MAEGILQQSSGITEDDTFKALRRKPFESVIYDMTYVGESISGVYRFIIAAVAEGRMRPNNKWSEHCGGWEWEDFKAECIKRHMEAYVNNDEVNHVRDI